MDRNISILGVGILLALSMVGPAWATIEHIILGNPEDEGEILFYPSQAEQGPDGNFYVLDSGDAYIKVFSPQGDFLRKFGGEGQGPGEFQRIDGASFGFTHAGEIFFTEFFGGHRWITVLDLEGRVQRVISLDLPQFFGVLRAASLPDGDFLVQLFFNPVPRPVKDYYLYSTPCALVRVDGQGTIAEELLRVEHTDAVSYSPDGGDTGLPFAPVLSWTLAGESQLVWTEGLAPTLNCIDLATGQAGAIATPLPVPQRVREAHLRAWVEKRRDFLLERNPTWWHRFGKVVEELKKPVNELIPIIHRLQITPAGNFLVDGGLGPDPTDRGYWLLDAEGRLLSRHQSRGGQAHFSGDCLFAGAAGTDGEVTLHVITGFVSESEALGFLEQMNP